MAAYVYDRGYDELSSGGGTTWGTSTVVGLLFTSAFAFDSTDTYVADLPAGELSGGGYARVSLGTFTRTATVSGEKLSAANVTYTSLGAGAGTPAWLVLARSTGSDATSPLLGAFELPGTAPDGGDYTLEVPSSGLFLLGPVSPYTLPEMLTLASGA